MLRGTRADGRRTNAGRIDTGHSTALHLPMSSKLDKVRAVGVRRPSATSVIGALAIVVALSGTAIAATGGQLLLGAENAATKTTTISNAHGVPLILHGRRSKPPFTVGGDTTRVPSLDAAQLDGTSPGRLIGKLTVFAKPGIFKLRVPAGVHHALIVMIGGGGGGGDGTDGPGGGGASGNYSQNLVPVTPGVTLSIDVAVGGEAGTNGSPGDSGGFSQVVLSPTTFGDYVGASGGDGASPGAACPASASGGEGFDGFFVGNGTPAGTAEIDGIASDSGHAGTWSGFGTSKVEHRGAGAGTAGFAGKGGSGGGMSAGKGGGAPLAAGSGAPGFVSIEWLR
jgi:hypothetical protein